MTGTLVSRGWPLSIGIKPVPNGGLPLKVTLDMRRNFAYNDGMDALDDESKKNYIIRNGVEK